MEMTLKLSNGRYWKTFEEHARKSLDCHEWDFKDNFDETLERKEGYRETSIFFKNTN